MVCPCDLTHLWERGVRLGWHNGVFLFLKRLSVTLSKFYFIISHSVSILTTNFYICYMVMEMKAFIWREGIISCPSSSSIIALLWRKRREKILLSQFSKVSMPERTFLLWAWLLSFSQVHRCLTTCACFISCCYFRTTVRKKLTILYNRLASCWAPLSPWGRKGVLWVPRSHTPTQRANSMRHVFSTAWLV